MKKVLLYLAIFIISFTFSFILTFPVDRVVGNVLTNAGVSYSNIEGNITEVRIKDISKENILIKDLKIKMGVPNVNIYLNGSNIGQINLFSRNIYLNIKDFDISSVQKNKEIFGSVTAKHKLSIKDHILIDGNGELFISRSTKFPVSNISVNYVISPDDDKNKIKAEIKGQIASGNFNGELYLPIDLKKGYIKGRFNGKIFSGNVSRNIYFKFSNLGI